MRVNPSNAWPFKSETLTAQNVTVGKFRLNSAQITRLGMQQSPVAFEDDGEAAIAQTKSAMFEYDFATLQRRGEYFMSSTADNDDLNEHVGQYRIRFHYCPCDTATIMAQQMQDDDDQFVFRKWNPEKKNAPWGTDTSGEQDSTCGNPICCFICMCVNCLFNAMFEEVVDLSRDGKTQSEQYFEEQESTLGGSATCFRWLGVFLCIFGHYLLFAPIINILNMIPFVGWLLSWIVAIAAVIFAIVVGLTLSVLTIAVAWVFFRPLIGIPLLIVVAASTYMIFFYDWDPNGGFEPYVPGGSSAYNSTAIPVTPATPTNSTAAAT